MDRERCAVRCAGDEGVKMGCEVRTAKSHDPMRARCERMAQWAAGWKLSALGEERPAARMFGGGEVLPVPRTGAAQARLTSGISGERSESAACRG